MLETEQQQIMPWYAIRTFNCKEMDVKKFIEEKGIYCFVPMTYTESQKKGKRHILLVPAIHNLLFIRCNLTQKALAPLLAECPLPLHVFTKPDSKVYQPISNQEMIEIRMLCDPAFKTTQYISQEEAETKIGKQVEIIKGPFKGVQGKLSRFKDDYFFVKSVMGMGVMIRISRWYCKVIDDEKPTEKHSKQNN